MDGSKVGVSTRSIFRGRKLGSPRPGMILPAGMEMSGRFSERFVFLVLGQWDEINGTKRIFWGKLPKTPEKLKWIK